MRHFVKEFKDFIAGGNLIEIASAFILGLALKAVIDAFVNGIMMQIIAAIFGQPDFSAIKITLRKDVATDAVTGEKLDSTLQIGTFINTVISLIIVGLVLFMIIKAYNRMKKAEPEEAGAPTDVELLAEIRDLLASRNS